MRAAVLIATVLAAASVAAGGATADHRPVGRNVHVPVLMYHLVGRLPTDPTATERRLTVEPALFAAQMEWLVRNGYHAITVQQLYAALELGKPLPSQPVLITFDDGYRDVLYNAEPVLHRLGMPAVAFVITDRIDGPDPSFLNWRQLRDLEHDGFTVGSHTVHHVPLTTLSAAAVSRELTQSRATLEANLGVPVRWFAYPDGAENAQVVRLVAKAGYRLAFTTHRGTTQLAGEPLLLDRYEVPRRDGVARFAALLHSHE